MRNIILTLILALCLVADALSAPPVPKHLPDFPDPQIASLTLVHQGGPEWEVKYTLEAPARGGDVLHLEAPSVLPIADIMLPDAKDTGVIQVNAAKVTKPTKITVTAWCRGGKKVKATETILPY